MRDVVFGVLVFVLVGFSVSVQAQPTAGIATHVEVEYGSGLQFYRGPFVDISYYGTGTPFNIIVLAEQLDQPIMGWEFTLTDLPLKGVMFKVGETWPGGNASAGDEPGEWIVTVDECISGPEIVLLRQSFFPFAGIPEPDTVVLLTGVSPSQFGGDPGLWACDGTPIETWFATESCGFSGSGALVPDGSLMLNPTPYPCPIEPASLTQIKARY